jgi:hypothetical protein
MTLPLIMYNIDSSVAMRFRHETDMLTGGPTDGKLTVRRATHITSERRAE